MYIDKNTFPQLSDNIKELIASGEVYLFKLKYPDNGIVYILRIHSDLLYCLDENCRAISKLNSISHINESNLDRVFFTNEAKDTLKLNISFQNYVPIQVPHPTIAFT